MFSDIQSLSRTERPDSCLRLDGEIMNGIFLQQWTLMENSLDSLSLTRRFQN